MTDKLTAIAGALALILAPGFLCDTAVDKLGILCAAALCAACFAGFIFCAARLGGFWDDWEDEP